MSSSFSARAGASEEETPMRGKNNLDHPRHQDGTKKGNGLVYLSFALTVHLSRNGGWAPCLSRPHGKHYFLTLCCTSIGGLLVLVPEGRSWEMHGLDYESQ